MKCSRCATELPDTATACPACGAAVLRSTEPVARRPVGAFSYLPAGTPAWPVSVPDSLPYVVESAPAKVEDKPIVVAPSRRSAGNIISIIAVLILVPLLGAAATLGLLYHNGQFGANAASNSSQPASSQSHAANTAVTPTANASSQLQPLPTPAPFKNTSDNTLNVSFDYPSDWTVNPLDKSGDPITLTLVAPQQPSIEMAVAMFASGDSSSIASASNLNAARIQNINSQGVSTQSVTSTPFQEPIAGEQWSQQEVTYSLNSLKVHEIFLSVLHNKVYYSIDIVMPDAYYQQAVQQYLTHMLGSFKFLS